MATDNGTRTDRDRIEELERRVEALEGKGTPAAADTPDQESTPAPAKSTADQKIDRIVEESKAETERGRQARRQS